MRYSEKLKERYKARLEMANWGEIKQECLDNAKEEDGELRQETFIGTVFNLFPSGKFYMPWTSNQTGRDIIRDEAYREAFEEVAEEHGFYVTEGEGDPCDIFVGLIN